MLKVNHYQQLTKVLPTKLTIRPKINISKKWKDITLIVEIFGNDPHIITSHNLDECKIFNWID